MTGYDFHPEVENDFAEIWDFIAGDSPATVDKVIADILDTIETPGAISPSRLPAPRPHRTAFEVYEQAQLPYRLRAGRKAIVGCGRYSWQPQPARDGRDLER
jgi:plasmid stabilization system protein ParE